MWIKDRFSLRAFCALLILLTPVAWGQEPIKEAKSDNEDHASIFEDNRVKFISQGWWACEGYFLGAPSFSPECQRLAFLADDQVRAELELSDSQRKQLAPILKDYQESSKELENLYLKRNKEVAEARQQLNQQLRELEQASRQRFDGQLEELLTYGQRQSLERIYLNAQLVGRGLVPALKLAVESKLVDAQVLTQLPQIESRQQAIGKELQLRCQEFLQQELETLKKILTSQQWDEFQPELDEALTRRYPSLTVALTEAALADPTRRPDPVDALSRLVHMEIQPGGDAVDRSIRIANDVPAQLLAYSTFYQLRKVAELTDEQLQQWLELEKTVIESVVAANRKFEPNDVGERKDPEGYEKAGDKNRVQAEDELRKILTSSQWAALERLCVKVQIEKYGLVACLLDGWLSHHLDVTDDQKEQIRSAYRELRSRYRQFANQSMEWIWEEALQDISDKSLRTQIRDVFELEFRKVRLPMGVLARNLTGRQGTERVGNRQLYQRTEEPGQ